jgi:hypothetical protein
MAARKCDSKWHSVPWGSKCELNHSIVLHWVQNGSTVWANPPKLKKAAQSEFCPKEFRADIVQMYRTHLRGDGHGWECHSDWALGEGGSVMNDSLQGKRDASPNNHVEGVLLGQISVGIRVIAE